MRKQLHITNFIVGILVILFGTLAPLTSVGANSYYGANGRITFYSPVNEGNDQEVYTVNPDGTDLKRVTNNSIPDANPQWSPCRASDSGCAVAVAFDSRVDDTNGHDIYVQPFTDTGSIIQPPVPVAGADTTSDEYDPSWSPYGTAIAFHKGAVSDYDIYKVSGFNSSFTGGTVTQLTNGGSEIRDTEPTWNKDGTYLVFTRQDKADSPSIPTCDWTAGSPDTGGCIAVVSASGGTVTYIDHSTTDSIASPQWSPVGNKVAYRKNGEVMIADLGDNMENLNSPVITTLVSNPSGAAPTWSPDGTMIAVSGNSGIGYYNSSTGALIRQVTINSNNSLGFDSANGVHEVDWARADAPANTTHECTTYVNHDCTTFTPAIPDACQTVTTQPSHGTANYSGGAHTFTPTTDYVGTDSYVYTYQDSAFNDITCTVNITVLPGTPDTGATDGPRAWLYALVLLPLTGVAVWAYRKHRR